MGGNSGPIGTRSPDRPARSQSLYRLSYPTHKVDNMDDDYDDDDDDDDNDDDDDDDDNNNNNNNNKKKKRRMGRRTKKKDATIMILRPIHCLEFQNC